MARRVEGRSSTELLEQPGCNIEHERQICSACSQALTKGIPLTVLRAQHRERLLREDAAYRERHDRKLAEDQTKARSAALVRDKAEQARRFGTADAFTPMVQALNIAGVTTGRVSSRVPVVTEAKVRRFIDGETFETADGKFIDPSQVKAKPAAGASPRKLPAAPKAAKRPGVKAKLPRLPRE